MPKYLIQKLEEERSKAVERLKAIEAKAETDKRDLNADETKEVAALTDQLTAIAERSKSVRDAEQADRDAEESLRAAGLLSDREHTPEKPTEPRSLGELFRSSGMAEEVRKYAEGDRFQFRASGELRAATDPTTTGNTGGLQTQYGQVLATRYRRLTIVDLLASGTLSQPTLTYWTQGTLTGDVAAVAEAATKPSLNFAFGQVTESLAKLAGVTKVTTEMTEDADFMVSVIESQLQARLGIIEEDQVLNGSGTAPNLRGLLNRSGIQTYATTATASPKKWLEGLFHAQNLVRVGSYIEPDGIVVHPNDYETMRLGVDGQQQYYGGGPFTGAYGNDGLTLQPGIWGLPTVVTPAIAQGTALVGAFRTAGQFFRKGGVTLDSTNSNEDDFKKNLVALRIEERVALAVYYPTAFCKVTLTA